MLRAALVLTLTLSLAVGISACGRGGPKLGERVIPLGQPVPKGGGRYLVGEPYDVAGATYYPREDSNYDRTGQASWYGELFHGRYTANGEIYDMDRLSAAHPTLPLPVYAQVTNLNNGRTIIVRVNDRGPFKRDRIIDLSRRSAEALGFVNRGTATVRVKYLGRAPLNGDDSYEQRYLASRGLQRYASISAPGGGTKDPIAVASIPGGSTPPPPQRVERPVVMAALPAPEPAGTVDLQAVDGSPEATGSTVPLAAALRPAPSAGPQIQAGSFKNKENAERARSVLSPIGPVDVAEIDVKGELFYRVRIGPFPDKIGAAAALPRVTAAGYQGAKIIMQN